MTLLTALITTFGLMLGTPAPAPTAPSPVVDDGEAVERALVKIKIKRGDKKPLVSAHMVDADSDAMFTLTDEGKRHQVQLSFAGKRNKLNVSVTYKRGGKKVLSAKKTGKPKKWLTFTASGKAKGSVSVFIDPDAKRADGVGITETEDPIEGAPPK